MADLNTLAEKLAAKNKAKFQEDEGAPEALLATNPISGFIGSSLSASQELFGFEPWDIAEQYREEHPAGGVASEFIGIGGPYSLVGKAMKGTKAFSKTGKAWNFIEDSDLAKSPFLKGAEKGLRTYGPFEALRVGSTALVNPEETEDTAWSAAANLGLEALGGGVFNLWRQAGKVNKAAGELGGTDLKNPPQLQMRDLKRQLAEGKVKPDQVDLANNRLATYAKAIRNEEAPAKSGYVKPLEAGDAKQLNRLFRPRASKEGGLSVKRMIKGAKDFPDAATRDGVMDAAGLRENLDSVQFPRHLSFKDKNTSRNIEKGLMKQGLMQSVGNGVLWNREKDGLFVLAKKVKGEVGKYTPEDEWVLWKTDEPGKFVPDAAKWAKKIEDRNAWLVDPPRKMDPDNPLEIMDEAQMLKDTVPLESYQELEDTGLLKKGVDAVSKKLGFNTEQGSSALALRGKEFVRSYLTPAMHQFKNNPRASYIHKIARATHDKAKALSHNMTYGEGALKEGDNLFTTMFKTDARKGFFKYKAGGGTKEMPSVKNILDSLSDDEIGELVRVADEGLDLEGAAKLFAKGELTEGTMAAVRDLGAIDDFMINQIQRTQIAAGEKPFKNIKGHYGLSRTWKGDQRIPIHDKNGKLVYVASGHTEKEVGEVADFIVGEAKKEGVDLKRAERAQIFDTERDIELATHVRVGSPEYLTASALKAKLEKDVRKPRQFKTRTGVKGYQQNFTRQELLDKYAAQLQIRNRYLAQLAVQTNLSSEMAKLGATDPKLYGDLAHRLQQLAGNQGEFSQMQNKAVDTVLSGVLGKNSASKIANTANQLQFHLTLGSMLMSFPVVNALTFIQTVMPKVAFTMKAGPDSLMRHYSWLPATGSDMMPRGGFGFMDMWKLMRNSVSEMRAPDETLKANYIKALSDGVVDPKFVEEFSGANASGVLKLKDVLSGKEPFTNYLKELSNFVPGISEKWSRGQAFTTGHMLGRDVFNLKDDALYRFSKEFTEQTMFNYGTADRARVMTGPMGSMFGLFKNWQTHYVADMLAYLGEGYYRGNWSPLLWQMGGTAGLGGVSALPMYGVADAFSQWASDEPLMNHIYSQFGGTDSDVMGGNMSDALFMGLPAFMGVSLSGQVAGPLADPSRDAGMLMSFVHMDRAAALGKAVGTAIDAYGVSGEHPIKNEKVRDQFILAVAPKSFARAMQITEDKAVKSLNTGNTITAPLNVAETLMYSTGVMPRRVALAHEANEQLWKDQKKHTETMQAMGDAWAEAYMAKDWPELYELQKEAMAQGIDYTSVIKSGQKRVANKTTPTYDRQMDEKKVYELQKLGFLD